MAEQDVRLGTDSEWNCYTTHAVCCMYEWRNFKGTVRTPCMVSDSYLNYESQGAP